MKSILVLMMTLLSFSSWADFDVSQINKELRNLNRIQELSIEGVDYQMGFITEFGIAYFQQPYDQFQMSVSTKYKETTYDINVLINDELITFKVPNGQASGTFEATKTPVKVKTHNSSRAASIELFGTTEATGPATKITVTLKKPLFGNHPITEIVTKTGTMEFNPCDGCEHGDQMMVGGINVYELDFGNYYTADCDGHVQRLLGQLFEHNPNAEDSDDAGLSVPFTFKGLINLDSGDLLEDLDSLWVSDSRLGGIYIGTTATLPVNRFIDSLVYKVAQKLNVEAYTIWDDVMENANFTSYTDNILTFTYKNITVKTNLTTNQTVE